MAMTPDEERFAPEWLKKELREKPQEEKVFKNSTPSNKGVALRVGVVSCVTSGIICNGTMTQGCSVSVCFVIN